MILQNNHLSCEQSQIFIIIVIITQQHHKSCFFQMILWGIDHNF